MEAVALIIDSGQEAKTEILAHVLLITYLLTLLTNTIEASTIRMFG